MCSTRLGAPSAFKVVPVKVATRKGTFWRCQNHRNLFGEDEGLGVLTRSKFLEVPWSSLQLSVCLQGIWSVLQLPWVHWIAAECAKPWWTRWTLGQWGFGSCHFVTLKTTTNGTSGAKKSPVTMLSRHNTTLGMSSCYSHVIHSSWRCLLYDFGTFSNFCWKVMDPAVTSKVSEFLQELSWLEFNANSTHPIFSRMASVGAGRFQSLFLLMKNSTSSQVYDHAICECSIDAPLEVHPSDWLHLCSTNSNFKIQSGQVDKFFWIVAYTDTHFLSPSLSFSRLYTWYG